MSMQESLPQQTLEEDLSASFSSQRRVDPIGRALVERDVWINGQRREIELQPADIDERLAVAETAGRTILKSEIEPTA